MTTLYKWIALALVACIMIIMDFKHLQNAHYNAFLLILFGSVMALIFFFRTLASSNRRSATVSKEPK